MSSHNDDHAQNISIDAAALVLDMETKDGSTEQIEAFSGPDNDKIIDSESTNKYNRLFWKSFGSPELKVVDESAKNARRYLEFDDNGFTVKFEMLTKEQRTKLAKLAQFKYDIASITMDQILFLNVDSFNCTTKIMNPSPPYNEVTFRGEALHGSSNIKTVRFNAPFHSNDRKVLDEFVKLDKQLEIHCELTINGKVSKTNSLTITTKQLKEIKLEEELFGDADSVYVTRTQMAKLTSNIKSFITSFENIELIDNQFDQTFTNDLLKKLIDNTTNVEEFVEIDTVLKCLSPYDYTKDITPDVIKKYLGKIYKIEKRNSKEHIVTNKESSNKTDSKSKVSGDAELKGMLIQELFGIIFSYNIDAEDESQKENNNKTLKDQLKEINEDKNNTIEWEIEGELIIPKRIKITKIMKSNLNKHFQFDGIKTRTFNKIINKKYSFSTKYIQEKCNSIFF
jgi:hypothetical protein